MKTSLIFFLFVFLSSCEDETPVSSSTASESTKSRGLKLTCSDEFPANHPSVKEFILSLEESIEKRDKSAIRRDLTAIEFTNILSESSTEKVVLAQDMIELLDIDHIRKEFSSAENLTFPDNEGDCHSAIREQFKGAPASRIAHEGIVYSLDPGLRLAPGLQLAELPNPLEGGTVEHYATIGGLALLLVIVNYGELQRINQRSKTLKDTVEMFKSKVENQASGLDNPKLFKNRKAHEQAQNILKGVKNTPISTLDESRKWHVESANSRKVQIAIWGTVAALSVYMGYSVSQQEKGEKGVNLTTNDHFSNGVKLLKTP